MTASALDLGLRQLRLSSFLAHWQRLSEQAIGEQWSPEAYLQALVEQEIGDRLSRRVQRLLSGSKLPREKTLEALDPSRLPLQVRQRLRHCVSATGSASLVAPEPAKLI